MNARPKHRLIFACFVILTVAVPSALYWRQYRLDRALIIAIHFNNAARVDTLLAEGANPSTRVARGKPLPQLILDMRHPKPDVSYTILMSTLTAPHLNTSIANNRATVHIVKSLLAKHADVNATVEQGETALMTAASFARSDCLDALVTGGANVNGKNANGDTALDKACQRSDTESVSELIRLGADVNTMDTAGYTPIMYAAQSGNANIILCLIQAHAAVNDKGPRCYSALKLAKMGKHSAAQSLLRAAGAKE